MSITTKYRLISTVTGDTQKHSPHHRLPYVFLPFSGDTSGVVTRLAGVAGAVPFSSSPPDPTTQ
jgi:hypothetical protein